MKLTTAIACSLTLVFLLAACSSPEEKAAEYIQNADELLEQGNLNKAAIEYKNALQINQNLPDAWYGLAKIHERKQEWRQAYASLAKIRDVNPNHVDGRIMLAQILLASNQLDQALADAKEVMELAPDDARAHSLMGAVQFRLGNYEASREHVERSLEIEPNNNEATLVRARVLIAEKKMSQALLVLEQAIKANPDNVSLYLMKIQAHAEAGDKGAIEGVYLSLIDRFPQNLGFRHALARNYMLDQKLDEAEKVLQEIVAGNPDNTAEKVRLASFVYQYRSVDKSIELIKGYIQQDNNNFEFRFKLGELYEKNSQADEARTIYQSIVDDDGLQPNGLEARNKIALLDIRAGEQDKARALVDEVLTQDKNNENGLLLRSGFRIAEQAYDDAIVDLRTVLRDNPTSIKALGLLGQAYTAKGSGELAIESYTKAFQISPATPVIANTLAGSLLRQNKAQQADGILRESMQKGNSSLDAVKILTQVKLALGEWDEAERLANQLKKVEGQEALSQQVMGVIFQGRDQQDQSINAFKRAHELAPESARPMVALVQSYVRSKKIPEAKRFLKNVLVENDDNVTAYMLLGQLSLVEQKTDEAIGHFSKLVEVNPKLDVGYRSLSSIYMRDNNLKKAEQITLQGMKAIPNSAFLQINLASIYERGEEFDKAIALYESMLEENQKLVVARNNLASLLTDHRNDQDSHDRARRIAAEFKDSRLPQFRDTYAWAAVKSGINLEEAVVILEKIVEENSEIGVYNYHLGEAYRKAGKIDSAALHLKKAVELSQPDSIVGANAAKSLKEVAQ